MTAQADIGVNAGAGVSGNVTSSAPAEGHLRFIGNGTVGGTTNVGLLTVNGNATATVTLTGAATLNGLSIANGGNLTFGNGGSVAMNVTQNGTASVIRNNGGTLTFTGGLNANGMTLQLDGNGGAALGMVSNVATLSKTGAGSSTVTGALAATKTVISGGGSLAAASSSLGAVEFDGTGGTISSGTGITLITGLAGLSGTGTMAATVTNVSVDNQSTNNGIVDVSNAASTLNNVVTLTGNTVRFGGAQITGAVTGAGTLDLNGSAQSVNTLGTNAGSRLGTVNMSGGAKTLNGNAFVTNMNIAGNTSTTGSAIDAVTLIKTAADANTATIANNVTATNVNVENGTLALNGTNSVTNVNMGVNASSNVTVLNGTLGTVSTLNHLGGDSTVTNNITATNTTIQGGGTMHVNGVLSNIGTLTFHTTGGTLAGPGGASLTSVVGHSDLTGTGTVNSQINGKSVTNSSTNNGIIHIANGASTLTNVSAVTGSTVRFTGAQITGTVTGAGTLDLDGTAQTLNTLGTDAANRLGTVTMSGGTKTLGGAAFLTNMNIAGGASTDGAGAITVTNLAKTGATNSTIDNVITATNTKVSGGGALTVSNAGSAIGALSFGAGGGSASGAGITAINAANDMTGTGTVAQQVTGLAVNTAAASAGKIDVSHAASTLSGATLGAGTELEFTGTTIGAVTGTGTLTVDGADQAIGAVGTLAQLKLHGSGVKTLNGAVNATLTDIGAVTANATNTTFNSGVNFSGNGTLNLASGTTTIGAVTSVPGSGTLTFTGGPLTINGGLSRINTLSLSNNLAVTGNAMAADNLGIGSHAMTTTGTFDTTANTLLNFFVKPGALPTDTPVTGSITATGIATVVAGTRVNMTVDTGVYVPEGQRYTLVSGGAGSTVGALGGLTTTNTALLHFRHDQSVTDKLVVYASRTQMNNAAKQPNNAAVGTMLDALGASGDKDVTDLQVRLANLMTATEVETMLSTLVPNVSGGSINAAVSVGGSTSTVVNNRVASLREGGDYGSGMAAGNWAEGGHFWGQVFGSKGDQDRRDNIAGYDSESYGTVFGVDAEVADSIRAGLAFAYANTDVDGEDINRTQTNLDSYQISAYGSYELPDNYFLTGQLSYMYSDIDTTRYNVGALAGNNAHADFSSNQYSIRTEVGRDYTVDGTVLSLTPSGTFNYTYVDLEDYTERGAGGLSLRNVDTDEVQILEFGGNLKAEAKFEDHAGGTIAPNLHAGYRYDVIGDKVATSGRLTGGGATFKTEGFEPSQHTVNAGAGIKWTTSSDLEFTVNYDFEHKSDYTEHSGFARAGFKF